MNRAALVHAYPQHEPPEDEPYAPAEEWREVWRGQMRIVRNRRRIRKLQRRGVPLMDLRACNADGPWGPRCMAWFVESKCSTCNDTGSVQDSEVPYLGQQCPDCK